MNADERRWKLKSARLDGPKRTRTAQGPGHALRLIESIESAGARDRVRDCILAVEEPDGIGQEYPVAQAGERRDGLEQEIRCRRGPGQNHVKFSPAEIRAEAGELMTNLVGQVLGRRETTRPTALDLVNAGRAPLSAYMTVPESYRGYVDLGRFRNALLLDQARRHPAPGLDAFIAAYRLQAYRLPETVADARPK